MAYKPLSRSEYENAIRSGMSPESIVESERERKSRETVVVPKKDFLQKATDIAGAISPGRQVGSAIGLLGGLGLTKLSEKTGLPVAPGGGRFGFHQAQQGESQFFDISKAPSPKRVLADVGAGGLTVAGFKGAGTTGSFVQRVATTFGIGAGLGGSQTIAKGGTTKEAFKNAGIVGAASVTLPVAGAGLTAIGRQIEALPTRFVNSALGRSKTQILRDISSNKSNTVTDYVLKNKPVGTANQMIADSKRSISSLGNEINRKLQTSVRKTGQPITLGISNVIDDVVKTPMATGAMMNRAEVKSVIERLAPQTKQLLSKPSLTIEDANRLRTLLDNTLGDRAFLGGQISSDKEILKSFANILRENVKLKAPPEVRGLFAELSNEIQLRNSLLGVMAQKSKNNVISFGDLVGGGIGGVVGGGLPGAAVGIGLRRTVESVPFKIGSAKLISAVSKVAPIIEELTPAQQTAILVLIADLVSADENDPE